MPSRAPISVSSGTPLLTKEATARKGLMAFHQLPSAAAMNGTTSQKYTHTRTPLMVRPPSRLTTPAATTKPSAINPTTARTVPIHPRGFNGDWSSASAVKRGVGQSTASATNDTTTAIPAPTMKKLTGTGRSARPPIPWARAGDTQAMIQPSVSQATSSRRRRTIVTAPPTRR